MVQIDRKKIGKQNRQAGARFELKVRKDLESKGWIVSRWGNNVSDFPDSNIYLPSDEREDRKLIPAKSTRFRSNTHGFPDFIAYKTIDIHPEMGEPIKTLNFHVTSIECKSNGYLDKQEKEKCKWLLENNIFSKILIAKKGKKRGEIIYDEFEVKTHGK